MVSSVQWTREEAKMINTGNDSSVVGREREAKIIDPIGGSVNYSVHGGRGHKKVVCAPL